MSETAKGLSDARVSSSSRFRKLGGSSGTVIRVCLFLSCFIPFLYVLRVNQYLGFYLYTQQILAVVLGLMLALTFLLVPARGSKASKENVPWYDMLFAIFSILPAIYIAVRYPNIIERVTPAPAYEYVLGVVNLLLVIEAVRRHVGWAIVIVSLFFIFHAHFAYLFPGFLFAKGVSWLRLASVFYFYDVGMYGIVLRVMVTIVIIYLLFSQMMMSNGGDTILTNAAVATVGASRGGPAKVAVVGSAAFGTISGSAAANVAVTGCVTIPLMKRVGYSPAFAGAVETAASSGGGITPPIMGTAAFIMAELLGVSYAKIVAVSFLPAVLYYVSVYVQVDLEAIKRGLKGLPSSSIPPLWSSVRACWWTLPPFVLLLVFLLYLNLPVDLAGLYSLGFLVLLRQFQRKGRLGLRGIFHGFVDTGRGMLMIIPVGALVGVIIGSITMSGLGANLSNELVGISGGNKMVLLVLTAVTCIILGMGVTATTAYLMLAVLVGPALIQAGIWPIGAHLFLYYFAILSFITPPVAVAAFVASGIAGASPFSIGFQAMRLAIAAFVIPFVFVFHPALLLQGSPLEIIITFISATIGIVLLAIALEGFLWRPLKWVVRILLAAAGVGFLVMEPLYQVIAIFIAVLCIGWEWRAKRIMQKLAA